MQLKSELIKVSEKDFLKFCRPTNDFSNLGQVENFWLDNITTAAAKVLARHFKNHNPERVIVEKCSLEVCKIIFTPSNFADSCFLDLINLNADAASQIAAVLPFTQISGLALEVLSPTAIERVGAMLPISKIQGVWVDRLTPEAVLRAFEVLSGTSITEMTLENITVETAVQMGSIRPRPWQLIIIRPENAEEAFLSAQQQRKPTAHHLQTQRVKVSTPANDQQLLITKQIEHNAFLQSVVDRQFVLLKQQQEFMRAELPGAARMPFFQDQQHNRSTKRSVVEVVAEADPDSISPTQGSEKHAKQC